MKQESEFVAPLKKAKGLGSAHDGTHHWIMQKVTAIALLPLVLWLVWSIVSLQGASYVEFTGWLSHPCSATMMILTIIAVFYHAKLGTQVIVEDYVSCTCKKKLVLIALKLGFFALGTACVVSVLKIAFIVG
jgi:succinate dehydrogenase / fumarate reductase, membrane anchor subunit